MKKPEFIKIKRFVRTKTGEKTVNVKNIRRAGCLGFAAIVFAVTVSAHTVMATAEEEYQESEESLLTDVVMNETGAEETDADKEETVYLITDASGNVEETIVSDWLKNKSGAAVIKDATNLSSIENVKGNETYTQDEGENLSWDAAGADIYYQGQTTKSAPIDIRLTYYLDGNEISPEDLAGKSGKVTIRLDYENHAKESITVGGEEEEISVPFTVISGMILPADTFWNIEVTNGKVVSDGNHNIVVGVAMPGLKESIDPDGRLSEKESDFEIPEYVEIVADVQDFSLDMTLSVAMPDILSDFKFSDTIDLTELEDSMNKLDDASEQLVDGTGSLKDGTSILEKGSNDLKNGLGTLDSGISQYTAGVSELTGGLNQLKAGSSSLSGGAAAVSEGVNALAGALNGMSNTLAASIQEQTADQAACQAAVEADKETVAAELTNYTKSVAGTAAESATQTLLGMIASGQIDPAALADPNVQASIAAAVNAQAEAAVTANTSSAGVQNALAQLAADSANLGGATGALMTLNTISSQTDMSKLPELVQGAKEVANGAATLDAGLQSALDGANQLNGSSQTLKNGSSQLVGGAGELAKGVTALKEGAGELNDGMIQFDEEGIKKLTGTLDGDVSAAVDRIDAVFDAGDNYTTFTKLAEGQQGRVKFIIRTGSVK